MHDASQFSRVEQATGRLPLWYWNRYVLRRLRQHAGLQLDQARVGAGARVLELGCGNRPYEPLVRQRGAEYSGADLPGNRHADLVVDENGRVPAPDAHYDAVLSIQVLEHVAEPAAYLAEARRLLKPGGQLLLSTHGIWVYHPSPLDLWRWTAPGLQRILEQAGFRIVALRGLVGMPAAALQLFQDHVRVRLPRWLRKPFTTLMQFLVWGADYLTSESSRGHNAMIWMVRAERPAG